MKAVGLHPGLERRLKALQARIGRLKSKMTRAKGLEKLGEVGDTKVLERRGDPGGLRAPAGVQ